MKAFTKIKYGGPPGILIGKGQGFFKPVIRMIMIKKFTPIPFIFSLR